MTTPTAEDILARAKRLADDAGEGVYAMLSLLLPEQRGADGCALVREVALLHGCKAVESPASDPSRVIVSCDLYGLRPEGTGFVSVQCSMQREEPRE